MSSHADPLDVFTVNKRAKFTKLKELPRKNSQL